MSVSYSQNIIENGQRESGEHYPRLFLLNFFFENPEDSGRVADLQWRFGDFAYNIDRPAGVSVIFSRFSSQKSRG